MAIPEVGLKAVIKGMSAFEGDARKVSNTFNKLDKQASKTAAGTNKSLKSMGVGGRVAFNLLTRAIQSGIRALGQFAVSVVQEGSAFQKEMSNVGAVSGAVGAEFDALSDQAKQLGAVTKFTAVEAAEGMGFLAMAGFETIDIIGAMPGVLDLAAASNIDLGKSADIVSNILSGFGASSESTSKFVDILTKTFTTSNTSLSSLGNAFKQVAPVAKNLGFTVAETAAAIGKLGDAGIQGFKAGTGLRAVFTTLAKTTGKAKAGMDELGVSVFDLDGNMRKLPDIIGQFEAGLAGMTVEQRQAALSTIFNQRQISTFSILLGVGEEGLRSYGKEVADSLGTASEIAAKQLDNLAGDFTLLQSALSAFKIEAFEALEPSLRETTQATTALVLEMGDATKGLSSAASQANITSRAIEKLTGVTAISSGGTDQLAKEWNTIQDILEDSLTNWAGLAVVLAKATVGEEKLTKAFTEAGREITGLSTSTKTASAVTEEAAEESEKLAGAGKKVSDMARLASEEIESLFLSEEQLAEAGVAAAESQNKLKDSFDDFADLEELFTVSPEERIAKTRAIVAAEEAASDAIIAARQREQESLISLAGGLADFVLGQQDFEERRLESQVNFSNRVVDIQSQSDQRVAEISSSLSEKLIDIEEKRQEKIHFVLTGAHTRTQQENDNALGFWNEHFDQLVADTTAKHEEKKQVVLTKQAEQEAELAAARANELQAQKEHIEELKLIAALGALESKGQLEQFTFGLAQSAQDAANLIQAGVIPVTEEMGLVLQTTLEGLATTSQVAMERAGANADVISQALAGTLIEQVMPAIENISGVTLPMMDTQFQTTAEVGQLALQSVMMATQNEGTAIDKISNTNLPGMQAAAKTATDAASKGFTSLGEAGKKGFEKIDKAAKKTMDVLGDLEGVVNDLADAFGDMASKARDAASAASAAKSAGGGGRQFGGPVFAGVPIDVGERGREVFVPPSDGFIVPNNLLSRLNVPAPLANQFSVPDISVPIPAPATISAPALGASTSITIQNQFTTTIVDQMDEAVFEEKVLRTVERGINA